MAGSVRVHSLRRRAGAELPNAVLQRNCALRRVGFALSYDARTITTTRTELGTWLDWSIPVDPGTRLSLLGRAAWAHDFWSAPNITAGFLALPGSSFVVTGAAPATDLLLASAGVEIGFRNGFSLCARFDGEFAENSRKYSGMGWLRYTW